METAVNALDPELLACIGGVLDPEIGVNVVDLGLVYSAQRTESGIDVSMTLTSRACPMGESVIADVRDHVGRAYPDVARVSVHLVWEPPWVPDFITDDGRRQLGHPPKGK